MRKIIKETFQTTDLKHFETEKEAKAHLKEEAEKAVYALLKHVGLPTEDAREIANSMVEFEDRNETVYLQQAGSYMRDRTEVDEV
jgi:phage/plasmid-associated DNA primase